MSKPNVLELATNLDLEAERRVAAASGRASRVKIERGHAWLIRILPFPQGPAKKPFAQLAQHWIMGRPVMCKAGTSPDFGGDPSYDCPICATAAACKNDARDDDERDEFYEVEARIAYRCYCLVIKKADDRGREEEMIGDELFIPHEFNIPKSSFNALMTKVERSKSRQGATAMGLLDLETGTDLWAVRDKKNSLTFDLSEEGPLPIFTLDEQFDDKLTRVWKQMRQPTVKFFDERRMDELANMVAEKAFEKAARSLSDGNDRGSRGGSRNGESRSGSHGRFHESDEADSRSRGRGRGGEQEQEEAPRRTVSRATGFDRARAALGDDAPGGDDQIPGAEVPARRTSPPAARRQAVETAEPRQEAPEGQDGGDQQPPDEAPPVSSRRGGATARPAAAAPGRVSVPAGVAAGRRAGAPIPLPVPKGEGGRVEDEGPGEGDPAPEDRDPAPAEQAEKAPVTQTTRPAPARSALQGSLRNSVAKLASSGR